MTRVYVDAGTWIALAMPDDSHHQEARAFFRQQTRGLVVVTSNMVLAETFTFLRYHRQLRGARSAHESVVASERIGLLELVWVTKEIHDAGWDIYDRYDDQAFSFTDCTSFVIARQQNVDFVFGFDADFRTMGFDLRP